ncbi:hypothetical protein D9757_011572 [Collybiopsis confluens]|uniref:Uncharacterized protein n=1 Tax=Collybiopsis confluens TaxID=2823264 RepID=A0A8H5GNF5_9AGAR|nr:hypothetical protein D9757_014141 [Collybiopsis confluens]KAF5368128.1 hypothetical protein D9757_011572 [Collybiopsis confluens]
MLSTSTQLPRAHTQTRISSGGASCSHRTSSATRMLLKLGAGLDENGRVSPPEAWLDAAKKAETISNEKDQNSLSSRNPILNTLCFPQGLCVGIRTGRKSGIV